ncbi:MAG: flagellar motor switch protein FliM [Candidatus Eisenbacteria bacterium]
MANILSQDEIDALMGAVDDEEEAGAEAQAAEPSSHAGEERERKVTLYDFRRPNRSFFREQLRIFESIHDGFARQYGAGLAAYLRSMVEIEIVSADQLTYGEYVLSLPSSTSLYIFNLEPLEGRAVMEVNPSLTLSIVDRLFGGAGKEANFTRDLTDIETAVMTRLVQRALSVLAQAWRGVYKIEPTLAAYETKPVMMHLMSNSESVVLITFELKTQYTSGQISLCYPYSSMEPIMPRITQTRLTTRRADASPAEQRWIQDQLGASILPVSAELGTAELTVREFLKMRVGDVLPLNRWVHEPVDLLFGGEPKALARPGLKGNYRCVQVESLIPYGGEDESGEAA